MTAPKTLAERVAELEATDRRHSNTHRGLADSVREAEERAAREAERVARATASDVKETTNADLLAAVRFLTGAIGDMSVANEQRHADATREREAMALELRATREETTQLRSAMQAMPAATKNAELEATRAKHVAASVGDDTTAILQGQAAQRRQAWARLVILGLVVPIATKLIDHC